MIRLRHADESAQQEIGAINITPFVDVMLVLLVIFMVTAPLTTVNVPVDLPTSTEKPVPAPPHPVSLIIKANHKLVLNEAEISNESLITKLKDVTHENLSERVFLSADKTIDYDTLMSIMNQLRQAGYLKIALVTRQEHDTP